MFLRSVAFIIFLASAIAAHAASTGEEKSDGRTRVEACSQAKSNASRTADIEKRAAGNELNRDVQVKIGDCDCGKKANPASPLSEYECTVSWSYRPS